MSLYRVYFKTMIDTDHRTKRDAIRAGVKEWKEGTRSRTGILADSFQLIDAATDRMSPLDTYWINIEGAVDVDAPSTTEAIHRVEAWLPDTDDDPEIGEIIPLERY